MQDLNQPCGHRLRFAQGAIALATLFACVPAGLAQTPAARSNPDWPCQSILVRQLSVAAVWSGPPIEGIAWATDPAVAALVAQTAARRNTLEESENAIKAFAHSLSADKTKKLTALFAGLFETLDNERSQIIDGLLRFGVKQRELASKIRAESAATHQKPGNPPRDAEGQSANPAARDLARDLAWDLRVFDERHRSIMYVCETPALIEQRLFALARVIQSLMD